MEFADKLNYLFELTHAEGKELAAAMNITPPQISKMRRGGRGLPRNRANAEVLARFFAQRCSSDFQRDALSKMLRVAQIRSVDKEAELTAILLDWLSDEQDPDVYAAKRADDFLRQFGTLTSIPQPETPGDAPKRSLSAGESSFMVYYGNEGKRLATENFLSFIAQRRQSCTIDVLTDEGVDWLYEDAAFCRRFQQSMIALTEQGCFFRRISGPIMDMDQAFESLNRWFPLYMTGKACSYYYKRMRDGLNRLTLFVVPGAAVMFSFSVGNAPPREGVTFFATDERTVNVMAGEFKSYLALCEPIMNVFSAGTSPRKMHACMLDYESGKGNCLQQSSALSFITLPWDVALTLRTGAPPEVTNDFLNTFALRFKRFMANLEQYSFTDIIRLADVDSVMSRRVPVPGAYVLGSEAQYYTPGAYLQHLRSVLYLLEHRPNYHVVLRGAEDTDNTNVYVKEGSTAILFLATTPFAVFEVSERYLVDAFAESLRRRAPLFQGEAPQRHAVIAEIRALAAHLEQRIRKDGQK